MDKTLKTNEQYTFEIPLLKKTLKEQKEIVAMLYGGVYNQYGVDPETDQAAEEDQSSKTFQDVLGEVEEEKVNQYSGGVDSLRPSKVVENTSGEKIGVSGVRDEVDDSIKKSFSCDFPSCEFETDYKIALVGHKKSHKDKRAKAVAGISR